ncbi:MAG: FMN-binding protein [Spirochaetales bacterium]|uniref:FMN-binding protein n=1 Tax=Candidatus Thalassospirochaeta sargassi TaxID=3119039 RepID=A0AAJ1MNM6_9SPIO|nr:FMN-binding protein [Spirochaetales bacterium]
MKQVSFFSERIKPVIIMAVITIICISLVSGIHLSTQELVIANEGLVLKKAVLYAAGVEIPSGNAEVNELYEERVEEQMDESGDVYIVYGEGGSTGGEIEAYAFIAPGPGLWGEIEMLAAFMPDLKTFAGIDFIKQNETPGLGARITEAWFKEQLRGKQPPLVMNPEGTESSASTEIDAITGASRTSDFVLSIFNEAGLRAAELEKEGM